jgi:hypothetical protein
MLLLIDQGAPTSSGHRSGNEAESERTERGEEVIVDTSGSNGSDVDWR